MMQRTVPRDLLDDEALCTFAHRDALVASGQLKLRIAGRFIKIIGEKGGLDQIRAFVKDKDQQAGNDQERHRCQQPDPKIHQTIPRFIGHDPPTF